jgi:hypothetical protein
MPAQPSAHICFQTARIGPPTPRASRIFSTVSGSSSLS